MTFDLRCVCEVHFVCLTVSKLQSVMRWIWFPFSWPALMKHDSPTELAASCLRCQWCHHYTHPIFRIFFYFCNPLLQCIRSWFKEQSTCPTCRNHSLLPEEYPFLKWTLKRWTLNLMLYYCWTEQFCLRMMYCCAVHCFIVVSWLMLKGSLLCVLWVYILV